MASPAYQQILAIFATARNGLRAKDTCHALSAGTTANHTEILPVRLKRLVARGVRTESEPGIFILATPATSSSNPDTTA